MNKVAVFVIMVFVFAACKKEKLHNDILNGNWKWVETVPVIALPLIPTGVQRPTAGETYILIFNSDGTYRYTQNDVILRSGTYTIRKNATENREMLTYSDQPGSYEINKNSDTLTLISDAPGAGYSKYVRF